MDIFADVMGQKIKIATNQKVFVTGTQRFVRFIFWLSDDWNGMNLFAQFKQNGIAHTQMLDGENAVYLPKNIAPGEFTLALQGTNSEKIAKTDEIRLMANKDPFAGDDGDAEIRTSIAVLDDALIIFSKDELLEEDTLTIPDEDTVVIVS